MSILNLSGLLKPDRSMKKEKYFSILEVFNKLQ